MTVGQGKVGVESNNTEHWVVDMLLPGLFTLILLGCLVHLGLSAYQSHTEHAAGYDNHYAISAFAN